MRARLLALAASAILFLCAFQPCWADSNLVNQDSTLSNLDLPAALAEDDSFDDLPFEQLRQALREEVERDPQRQLKPRTSKRYNLLIR